MSQGNEVRPEPRQTLSQRRPLRRFLRMAFGNWLDRHRHPFNRLIHIPGILLAVTGVVLLFCAPWYWGVGAIVVGYFLQWLGHLVEGNDVGEWAGIKRLLGLPYVSASPLPDPREKQPAAL